MICTLTVDKYMCNDTVTIIFMLMNGFLKTYFFATFQRRTYTRLYSFILADLEQRMSKNVIIFFKYDIQSLLALAHYWCIKNKS